jgi:DNA-binding LacI/PurR family transcriptional regulator
MPSIRDVARLAQVSHQTVSRVLNQHPSIRPETKQRVIEAMETLQYRPNRAARALVTSRSRTVGVLMATSGEYGPSSSVAAIEDAARAAGYWVNTANLSGTTPDAIVEGVEHLMEQAIEGLIVIAPQVRVFNVLAELSLGVPFVSLQSATGALRTELAADQVRGARIATEHLIDLGHHEIVHLAGPRDWIEAESRMQGYLEAMSDADLPTRPPILGDWTADFGYFAGRELARRRDFSAVFAANDLMAVGVMHGFRDAGFDVPRAVSVVGFDDIPVAPHVWPPLTTVHQDFDGLGRRTMALLLAEMRGERAEIGPVIEPQLVVRESTSSPLAVRAVR